MTTLLSRHDKALAEGVVTEQQLQHLQQQVSNQGSVLRAAKEGAKADASSDTKHKVTFLSCALLLVDAQETYASADEMHLICVAS